MEEYQIHVCSPRGNILYASQWFSDKKLATDFGLTISRGNFPRASYVSLRNSEGITLGESHFSKKK